MRGASEFEPGSDQVCPQGTPLLWFADNEAHHCGSYGLRIFTNDPAGEHRGPSGSGYYPVATDPCAAASATNPYLPAKFRRQYSWRNGKNGVTVGSVAAIHLIDMVVADNNKVGFEFVGADGIQPFSMTSETKLRGKWGDNLLVRPLIVGHMLSCPSCDPSISLGLTHVSMGSFVVPDNGKDCLNGCQTFDLGYEQRSDDYLFGGNLINAPRNDGNQNGKRLGLETPAWYGLTVQNTIATLPTPSAVLTSPWLSYQVRPHRAERQLRQLRPRGHGRGGRIRQGAARHPAVLLRGTLGLGLGLCVL